MSSVVKPEIARAVTPLGIMVEHLKAAARIVEANPNIPTELTENLIQAWRLAVGLDPYVEECTSQESSPLNAIALKTQQESWGKRFSDGSTVRPLEQEMLSGHVEGQVLKMFVHMTRSKSILDIGMFTGYSALAMAEALPSDGRLVACEVDRYVADFAQTLFQNSPHGAKIHVELGAALETLSKLAAAKESFDLVFIDADKTEYIQYFQTLLDTDLLAPDGFICVDNTLLQGQPYLPPEERTKNGEAIAQFNRVVKDDPRVEQVLLPVRDGLTIIRRVHPTGI
ncbi:MAG TPA: SAM-dependent methyltransferase [Cyanobacteria bacterium UBA8553]|nr:SAM-dependent methyltransferase [Cyanobacteria bacterium UBA8553]HAJ64766.1 SAM-dependent methyltransferase [Cyanobacteria bacterium UBA8543]